MQALPKISIITPSYNQGQYIDETIVSIIGQGYGNLEYIVIDGGSTDNTLEVLKKHEQHISYWVSEKDKGQSDAINKGLKKATGDIVAWLNSDDIYAPGVLDAVAAAFSANPDVGIIYGNVESFYPDGKRELWVNNFDPADFFSRVSIHQPGVFWRRNLHDTFGYIDESFYYLMDYDFWARIFFNTPSLRVDKVFAHFRVHDSAKTGNNPIGLYDDYRRVISRIVNSLPTNKLKDKFQKLGIYHNNEQVAYPAFSALSSEQETELFRVYLHNYILQEYTRGNIGNTNRLIFHSLNEGRLFGKLVMLLKNNLGVAKIKNARHAR